MTTISWKSIGHNWDVYSSDGQHIGEVFLVVGDENEDMFDGLAITHKGHEFVWHNYVDRPHYVEAEQVASIDEGRVTLSITADAARALPPHDPPESAEIAPEGASKMQQLETWFEDKTRLDHTE